MKNTKDKLEISLLTLLAHEATPDARKLLKKYGKTDAVSYQDLEQKLADLYFKSSDQKLEIEKDFAAIHPHKKWLLRNTEQPKPAVEVKEEKKEVVAEVKPKEVAHCSCPACEKARVISEIKSSAEGQPTIQSQPLVGPDKTGMVVLGIVGVMAIYGLIVMNKK